MTTEQGPAPGDARFAGSDATPFWSVMIPVYNSTKYLARTLQSVLDQDPGPARMQIQVIDGHSSVDLPEALVRDIGGGRIEHFRHEQPLSMAGNWNSCIERARGEFVHILHSDDYVLPGFYARLEASLRDRREVGAAFTRWTTVDSADRVLEPAPAQMTTAGVLPDGLNRLGAAQVIQFPAMVVRKTAYQQVGGFRGDLTFALDWEMWVRLAARFPVWYEPELLACYRVHPESETRRLQRLGEDLVDQVRTIGIIRDYLPPHSKAREGLALRLIEVAKGQCLFRLPRAGLNSLGFALRLSRSPRVVVAVLQVSGWALAGVIRVGLRRLGFTDRRRKGIGASPGSESP